MNRALLPADEISLESKVAFLRHSTGFQQPACRVEAIETHMSWVFLTGSYAYKLKKPVQYEYLDFSTIDSRRHYCEEEIRLNRRLAESVYIGVVPLTVDLPGRLQLGGDGKVIDWLVQMHRLPADRMLDYGIRHGTTGYEDIDRVALRLADFYRTCEPVAFDPHAYRQRLGVNIDRNAAELVSPGFRLPAASIAFVQQAQHHFLKHQAALLDRRVAQGRIVEGHGDLRPEHICLNTPPVIIDCLEFSRDLRIADIADELGFLALECERLDAARLGTSLLQAYGDASGDWPEAALVHFYQSYRASLRAKIAIRHLNENKFSFSDLWRRRALKYLEMAAWHIRHA